MSRKHNKVSDTILKPSSKDTLLLFTAVGERMEDVIGTWRRVNQTDLLIPEVLYTEVQFWNRMKVRYEKGDMRNTRDELRALRLLAQWSLDMNCKLRNQVPKIIQWKD